MKTFKVLSLTSVVTVLLMFLLSPLQAQSVNARNQLKIARSYADQDDWEKAKEYADRALKEEAGYIDAMYMRAFAHRELKMYDKAVTDFKDVIRVNPSFLATYGALAETFLKQKKYDEADKVFVDLSNQPRGAKWASYYRGVVAYLQTDLPRAERFWREVLSEDVNFAPAHHNLGALSLAQKNYPKALSHLREAAERKPDRGMYRFHVAWALERVGQVEAALSLLLKITEDNIDARKAALLSESLKRLLRKRADLAKAMLESAAEEFPDTVDVWILLGRASLALNAEEAAREALEKAKEVDPNFQEITDLLGTLSPAKTSEESNSYESLEGGKSETLEKSNGYESLKDGESETLKKSNSYESLKDGESETIEKKRSEWR